MIKLNKIRYEELSEEFIRKHADIISWNSACLKSPINVLNNLLEDYKDEISWDLISHRKLPEKFIREHEEKLSWKILMKDSIVDNELSDQFFNDFGKNIDWERLATHRYLSSEFIERHQENLSWDRIVRCQSLSDKFIRKHIDKLNFKLLANFQALTPKFITEFSDSLPWDVISENQRMTKTFIKKNKKRIVFKRLEGNFSYMTLSDKDYEEIKQLFQKDKR